MTDTSLNLSEGTTTLMTPVSDNPICEGREDLLSICIRQSFFCIEPVVQIEVQTLHEVYQSSHQDLGFTTIDELQKLLVEGHLLYDGSTDRIIVTVRNGKPSQKQVQLKRSSVCSQSGLNHFFLRESRQTTKHIRAMERQIATLTSEVDQLVQLLFDRTPAGLVRKPINEIIPDGSLSTNKLITSDDEDEESSESDSSWDSM